MKLDAVQEKLLDLFIKQELLICALYKHFARRYHEHKTYWSGMAIEEFRHAALLKRIADTDSLNKFKFVQGELRTINLTSSVEYIEGIISEFKCNKKLPITHAVSVALQIEKGLWERKVFQYFVGDSDDVVKVLHSLDQEIGVHIQNLDNFGFQFLEKKH
ncbi:MAG: hypothetical protein PHI31_08930 [Desulfuromonadaceae bacterium]|nr:hypothetical protein [Desulfuromonadaceae bacterium]